MNGRMLEAVHDTPVVNARDFLDQCLVSFDQGGSDVAYPGIEDHDIEPALAGCYSQIQ